MKSIANGFVLGALLMASSPLWAVQAPDGFVGRWDLSVGPGKRPSWLEVSRDGEKLLGRFVASGGGVNKLASIEVRVGKLSFRHRKALYTATLVDGKLQGTITQGRKSAVTFVGVKFEPKVDVTGTWKVISSDGVPYDLKLVQRGDTLTGKCVNQRGVSAPIYDASLRYDKISFSFNVTKKNNQVVHRIEAEVTGDRIKAVTRATERDRTKTFTGRRQRAWGKPIELFNGKDLTGWEIMGRANRSHWVVSGGVLNNPRVGANIKTTATFKDFKLHIETKVPEHGNSGVYLRGRYEVQVADSHGRKPAPGGMGAIYNRIVPSGNPSKPAGEWQTLDIRVIGCHVTVSLNGEMIINNREIEGITGGAIDSNEAEPGPIYLQGNHGPIAYRKIVLTPLVK